MCVVLDGAAPDSPGGYIWYYHLSKVLKILNCKIPAVSDKTMGLAHLKHIQLFDSAIIAIGLKG